MIRQFILSYAIFFGISHVSSEAQQVSNSAQQVRIRYGSGPWNLESQKIDSAFLFLKDKTSKRIVKILLEETEPDSSTFSGSFAIGFSESDSFNPEVFVPPPGMRLREADGQKFNLAINQGKVARKPIVMRKDEKGNRILEVYDTREQAERAVQIFKEEVRLRKESEDAKKSLTKPIPSETTLAAAQVAEKKAFLEKMALENSQRESERLRMEQIEKQKMEESRRKEAQLAQAERNRRKKEAEALGAQALQFYQAGDFAKAEELFRKSVDLDPSNTSLYFRYGITLYRTEKFNEALVVMNLAADEPETRYEKQYYMGLIHYRLKELDKALLIFANVRAQNIEGLSSSSAFYQGLIYFGLENFDNSRSAFEYVLDTSKDPRMDEQAEDYIEKIAQLQAYRKNQGKTFILNGTLGLMYDSNVLLAPDNVTSQGASTDKGAFRYLIAGDAEYRLKNTDKHELSTKLAVTSILSAKDSFVELDSELGRADPYLVTLTAPYSYKGTAWKKGYKFTLNPGYEILYMDPNNTGSPQNILRSVLLGTDNTFIMNESWFSSYILDLRIDDSLLPDSSPDTNADSLRTTLKTNQIYFLDKTKKRAVIGSFGAVINTAQGKEKNYNRIEAGATYMAPTSWESTWMAGLAVYRLAYPDLSPTRSDFNIAVNAGFSKPMTEWFTWGVNANYTNNTSDLSTSQYSKYSLMTTATFNTFK